MKRTLLAGLLLVGAPAAWAQTATVKTKTKSETDGTSVKTKTAAPAPAAAQRAPAPKLTDEQITAKARELTLNLKQGLSLSPQQEVKVQEINERSIRQVETARVQYRSDLRKLNLTVDDIGQARLSALKDALTPAQFARYQQQREKKMGIPNVQGVQGNAVPGLRGQE
ncbi:hypothetical protein [Hymenobacter koreensis]|uniref:Periplasmic heavy metal sensor n=1 Tax=Hymenobacter koreensis TaxID=1084523 RepID=A0ABP8J0P5_9BACT